MAERAVFDLCYFDQAFLDGFGIYELSLADGFKSGDSNKGTLTVNLTLTDGLKPGDSSTGPATMPLLSADGLQTGDTPLSIATLYNALQEGLKAGDMLFKLTHPTSHTPGSGWSDEAYAYDVDTATYAEETIS